MGLDFDFSMLDAMDILDLAVFVEAEAAENYEQLATWSENHAAGVSEFFRRMSKLEELHGSQIAERRRELFSDTPAKYSCNIAWEVEVVDYDSIGDSLSLRQALDLAMGVEVRAQQYYEGALEYVSEEQTVKLLEDLRDSEREHQRLLQEEIDKL